jgi:2-keto-4-pentenoate hydratase/2-oxohepta-3-ene-1,7-dioic acid hydratase in catechol pathway
MKLGSFLDAGVRTWGMLGVAGLRLAPDAVRERFPGLRQLIAAGLPADVVAACAAAPAVDPDALPATLRFQPVIPDPARILCVGINYLHHIREMGREPPDYPTLFTRFPESLVGHREPLVRPRLSMQYDFEGEVAVVIGRRARYVQAADALGVVAGWTIFFDGSIRDWQYHTSQFIPGKNFPATGSCGPWLVTPDELPDPRTCTLETRVNGEVLQAASVGDLCFDVPAIIEYLSSFTTLEPGDIIATGTPAGVGYARKPQRWLQPGDRIEVAASGIGVLGHTVIGEQS